MVWTPVVLSAVLFAAFGWRYGATPLLLVESVWVLVLVHVIVFDLEHRLILDRVTFPSYAVAFLLSLVSGSPGWRWSLVAGVAAGVAFGLFAMVGALVFRAEVLGMGDVKLAVFIGLVAGAWTAQALLLGIILAGVTSIVLIVVRVKSLHDTIAYGPYLCAGTLVVLLQRAGG
jgi:leader peptidase (prepilin peptidase)/N-methyltransferase